MRKLLATWAKSKCYVQSVDGLSWRSIQHVLALQGLEDLVHTYY